MYSEQEGIREREQEQNGLYIENVCGTKKGGTFFLCMSKALIMFMVCIGTVTGFCDAFSIEYNKTVIIVYTLAASCFTAFLFYKKKLIYIGLLVTFGLFITALSKASVCFSGGLRALSDIIRENYAAYYHQYLPKTPNPYYEDDYVSITVVLIFIIAFLLILYNIAIVRYMSFAETFAISFIILEIPMFIGKNPGIISTGLIMAGCIAIGLIRHGSNMSIDIPIYGSPDFIKETKYRKTRYTTVGSHKGILMVIAFSVAFSVIMLMFTTIMNSENMKKTPESELKIYLDQKAKIVAVEGVPGLFDEEAEPVFIGRGDLGKVSKIEQDNETDIVVTLVPYSSKTIYLPGFYGLYFKDMKWYDSINTADFPELGFNDVEKIDSEIFESFESDFIQLTIDKKYSPKAKTQITYVDSMFDYFIFPYYKQGLESAEKIFYQPKADKNGNRPEYNTRQAKFYVPDLLVYNNHKDYWDHIIQGWRYGSYVDLREVSKIIPYSKKYLMYGEEYIDGVCLDVPDDLDEYLEEFITAHDYFGVEKHPLDNESDETAQNEETETEEKDFLLGDIGSGPVRFDSVTQEYIEEVQKNGGNVYITDSSTGFSYNITKMNPDGSMIIEMRSSDGFGIISGTTGVGANKSSEDDLFEKYEAENTYRLEVCEAIKDMFAREYLYTLSPGMTPVNEDYVRYFLETQKQGVCTHFASAAVMLLRHMGIPAKYVEGYCIPSSLIKEKGKRADVDGDEWFPAENPYNPRKKAFTVEVSDKYAHAWIEVYLEGKGFVPFEVTPASYVTSPEDETILDDNETETKPADATPTPAVAASTPTPTTTKEPTEAPDKEDSNKDNKENKTSDTASKPKENRAVTDTERLFKLFGAAICVGIAGWLLIMLSKKAVKKLRLSMYLKQGRFDKLVYIRYCELVERLKKKHIVTADNPLPMELCEIIARYTADEEVKDGNTLNDNADIEDHDVKIYKSEEKIYKKVYEAYSQVFEYMEKVLYAGYKTTAAEYNDFYSKLRILK